MNTGLGVMDFCVSDLSVTLIDWVHIVRSLSLAALGAVRKSSSCKTSLSMEGIVIAEHCCGAGNLHG